MTRLQSLRDAIAVVLQKRGESTDVDAIWKKLHRVGNYLDQQASQVAIELMEAA
jgi:hypothetical protein